MMNILRRIYDNSYEAEQGSALSRLDKVDKERFEEYKYTVTTIKALEKNLKVLEQVSPSAMFPEARIKTLLLVNKKFLDDFTQALSSYGPEYALYDKKIK